MAYQFNPLSGNLEIIHDRLVSKSATAGDTLTLTSDGTIDTLTFSRGRVVINQSGGTNRLTLASTGVGIGVAPGSIGATLDVQGTGIWNVPNASAAAWDLQCGGIPYLRFVTSAGARNLELGAGGAMKLVPTSVRWDGHFLPTDLSSNYDIGGTPANYWRNAYFAGTVYATGGVQAIASATQAASILLQSDAAQNATFTIKDELGTTKMEMDVDGDSLIIDADSVIFKNAAKNLVTLGESITTEGGTNVGLALYDNTSPGVQSWSLAADATSVRLNIYKQDYRTICARDLDANNYAYTYHFTQSSIPSAGHCDANTTTYSLSKNAGSFRQAYSLLRAGNADNMLFAALGVLETSLNNGTFGVYGAPHSVGPLNASERVRWQHLASGVNGTLWALDHLGNSFQARDAHIVSDTYGLMLGAGTGGGAGDARLYYDGTNVALDNLIGSGFFDVGMGLKSTAYVNAYETSTSGAFNALASGTTRPGLFVKTGASTTEVVMAMNSGGYAYGSMYGWYMMIDEGSTGDWWLKAGDGGAPIDMLRCYRGTRRLSVGGDAFGTSVNGSIYLTGVAYARRGVHFNYDQNTSVNNGNFVWSSNSQVYMIYGDATNNAVGFGTSATSGGTLNYAAGRTSTNKAGTYISCAGVSDNFLMWFSANPYAGAGGYGWGYLQEEASYGDHQFLRQDGGALTNVMYYKRSNGFVGIGPGWTGAAPPQVMVDVVGSIHTDTDIEIDGALNHDGTTVGFYGVTPVVRAAHIVDADGSLADVTAKLNTLLVALENIGILNTA